MRTLTCAILTLGLAIFSCIGCGSESGKPAKAPASTGGGAPAAKPPEGAQDGPTTGGLVTPAGVEQAAPATEEKKVGAEKKASEEKQPAEGAKPTEEKKSDEKNPG